MLTSDNRALFEGGASLIVGLVDAGGKPHATRGWGVDFEPGDDRWVRLLVAESDAADFGLEVGDEPSVRIGVTASDVGTLESVQIKGWVRSVEAGGPDELVRKDRHFDEFMHAVDVHDQIGPEVLECWRPTAVRVLVLEVDESFSQTPGPGAGAPLGRAGS